MAIYFTTNNPDNLLKDFKKKIDQNVVQTWSYDQDGDFTHTASSGQWTNKAWLRPKIQNGKLIFTILKPANQTISSLTYAVYHGRFIESMLNHCDSLFSESSASAFPKDGDLVS